MQYLTFTIDDARYAVAGMAVIEIVRAVAITPLPNAPGVIEGIVDVRGAVIPVFNLRIRFGLPIWDVQLSDHFVIVRTAGRMAALHVDHVLDLVDIDEHAVTALDGQVHSAKYVAGVATLPDGLAVIHDVEAFLSRAEEESLDAALASEDGVRASGTMRLS